MPVFVARDPDEIGRVWPIQGRDGKGTMRESVVAQARISMKLSQSQFAELLGVTVPTLQQWEQGRREPTGAPQTLIKVAIHERRRCARRWRRESVISRDS